MEGRCFGLFIRLESQPFVIFLLPITPDTATSGLLLVTSQLLTIKVIPTFPPALGAQRQYLVLDPFAIPLLFCSCSVLLGLCSPCGPDWYKEIKGPFPPGHKFPCLSLQARGKPRVVPGRGRGGILMGTWKNHLGLCGLFSSQANVTHSQSLGRSLEIVGEQVG